MDAGLLPRYSARAPSPRGRIGALVAFGLHGAVAFWLMSYEPARALLASAAPVTVELLTMPAPRPAVEKPALPPKPKPTAAAPAKPAESQPLIAAPETAPAPLAAATQPSAAPASTVAEPQPAAFAPAPKALPVTEPVYNAAYLDNPSPPYPSLSRRSGEQGKVLLRVLVNATGRADEVQVRATSGSSRLDESARATVLRWKFLPARRGDEAVAAWVLIPISFRLEG